MKKCFLVLLFPLPLFAQPQQGGGPFPTPLSSSVVIRSNGVGVNTLFYSNDVLSADVKLRQLFSYDGATIFDWSTPGTAVVFPDLEIGNNLNISGLTSLGDAVTQGTWATGRFMRQTNTFGHGGSPDGSWSLIDTNGDFISSNAVKGMAFLFTNAVTFTPSNLVVGSGFYVGAQNTAAFTVVNTNFVQGFIYTNFYSAPIQVNANIRVTTATVAGDADMDFQQPVGTLAARVGLQSVAAQTNECHLIWTVPINGTYAISNTLTTGSGNAVIVIGGQIFVY